MSGAHLNKRMADMKFFLGFLTGWIFLVLLSLVVPTHAGEIYIAGVTADALTFTEQPGTSLEVSSALGFDGNAFYQPTIGPSDIGLAQFGALDFLTGPEDASGNFVPIPPAQQSFNYQSLTGPDELMSILTWNLLVSNAAAQSEPQLVGDALIIDSVGGTNFEADFPIGSSIAITANFPLTGACDLTTLAAGSCHTTFETVNFEGATVLDSPPVSTPEPGSSAAFIFLMVAAMIGFHAATPGKPRRRQ